MTRIFFRAISYDFPPPPDVSPRPGIFPEDDRSGRAFVRISPFFPHPLPGSITLLGDYRDDFPPTLGGTAFEGPRNRGHVPLVRVPSRRGGRRGALSSLAPF